MSKFAFFAPLLAIVAVPAFASAPAVGNDDNSTKTDVNKIVCQKEETIGSRLAAKKICLTVKEWRDRAVLNREETERVQQNTGTRPGS